MFCPDTGSSYENFLFIQDGKASVGSLRTTYLRFPSGQDALLGCERTLKEELEHACVHCIFVVVTGLSRYETVKHLKALNSHEMGKLFFTVLDPGSFLHISYSRVMLEAGRQKHNSIFRTSLLKGFIICLLVFVDPSKQ